MESIGEMTGPAVPEGAVIGFKAGRLGVTLLGPLRVERGGEAVPSPPSRKVRALLAYLLMAPRPLHRSKLCEMFWDVPNDPRGELRWCLSKIRGLIDTAGEKRLVAGKDWVSIDRDDVEVDALTIDRTVEAVMADADPERLRRLATVFAGEFLEGLDAERMPLFEAWLADQRERFRGLHARLLARCAASCAPHSDDHLRWLRSCAALRPYDLAAQSEVLGCLAVRGDLTEGEAHLVTATRLFESGGLNPFGLKSAWRRARAAGLAATAPPPAGPGDRGSGHPPLHALVAESFASRPIGSVAEAPGSADVDLAPAGSLPGSEARRARPAIAVLPFANHAAALGSDRAATVADGLLRDIVRNLARCRTIAVIAASSAKVLAGSHPDPVEAGRLVGVAYVCAGMLSASGHGVRLDIELIAVAEGRVLRSERYDVSLSDVEAVGVDVATEAARLMASEIEFAGRGQAAMRPAADLDAWEAYHRGMWHLHRLNRDDNALALAFFGASVRQDATFARAHAGLSFAHWLAALMFGAQARDDDARRALDAASAGVRADPFDPSAHGALGRAFWMDGAIGEAVDALETATALSPNYACGHYSLGIVQAFSGDPAKAIVATDQARQLSPFDPFLGAMHASRAVALLRIGRTEEAAAWGLRAARTAQAHPHVMLVAAVCAASAGRSDQARQLLGQVATAGVDAHAFVHMLQRSGVDPTLLTAIARMQGAR